jgi:hypothetical protein
MDHPKIDWEREAKRYDKALREIEHDLDEYTADVRVLLRHIAEIVEKALGRH